MRWFRTILASACFLLLLAAAFSFAETEQNPEPLALVRPLPKKITFIYVHGFGEHREIPPFQSALDKFLSEWDIEADSVTYRWDDLEVQPTMVIAQWNKSKKTVLGRTPDFIETVLQKYERERKPYVLVGYSLGSRLVADSLKKNKEPLQYLKGVYFLGSALPNDYPVQDCHLPEGMKISNYYSAKFDAVLKVSFYHAEGVRAGGETGFENPHVENYRTACHHLHIGGPIHRDYSTLAPAIAYLTFYKEGIFLNPGEKELDLPNLTAPAGSGELHWNEISRFGDIIIEQNANADIFRAVNLSGVHKRTTIGRSRNMHQLLFEVGIFKPEDVKMEVDRAGKPNGRAIKKNQAD